MFKINLLKDEKVKQDYKNGNLTNEEYINKLIQIYYKK